jgi:hypothetical protein
MSSKELTFTKHAKNVLVKRRLDEDEVLNAINSADEVFWIGVQAIWWPLKETSRHL